MCINKLPRSKYAFLKLILIPICQKKSRILCDVLNLDLLSGLSAALGKTGKRQDHCTAVHVSAV